MRLLIAVQRFGPEVAGGAESLGRDVAHRLAERGHEVSVATTCARRYSDWADEYPRGESRDGAIAVHRFPVEARRDPERFGRLNARLMGGDAPIPLAVQREWMRMQGPWTPAYESWMAEESPGFDAVVFITYLYWTTWAGLRAVAGRVPTVLLPAAHDEPPLRLSIFDEVFRSADAFAFLTEEEEALVRGRFRARQAGLVTGAGVDLDVEVADAAVAAFRREHGLGDRPYLVSVGRLEPGKGVHELVDYFDEYKRRGGGVQLVVMGDPVHDLAPREGVCFTGFVDEPTRRAAVQGALALVQPSYFESFSLALAEAWAQRRPALVQRACAALDGQARRSEGAIPYRGFAEFEAAIELLAENPRYAQLLAGRGRRYVVERYAWGAVLDRFEAVLEEARTARVTS